ncbi:transporter substrate-binding domain-containing protein [Paroceanicella profunda]|uniref:transporter substrate-binding domain-containing protein n=1 Tax=Paroceanicella profunda TaxID=2579971 RepID=UPI0014793217|nr:transporter substrate-binding domain-containing protein [Paroceanicella profunda]
MRRLGPLLLSLLLALPGAPRAQEVPVLRVGVREDAKPFSYRLPSGPASDWDGPLHRQGYSGYVVRLCDGTLVDVQRRHRFTVEAVPITARTRFDALKAGGIDILCDPATITRTRLTDHLASPPVYLSGVTYARRVGEGGTGLKVGVVGNTTSQYDGIEAILRAGEWPQYREDLKKQLYDLQHRSTAPCGSGDGCGDTGGIVLFDTHRDLAQAFCRGELSYYVGDFEIVKAMLDDIGGCTWEDARETYTDERYAIFVSDAPERGALKLDFLQALSSKILLSPSLLDEAFEATFPGAKASRKLRIFFWTMRGER